MKSRSLLVLAVAVSLLVVACDDGAADLSTTSSVLTGTTAPPAAAEDETTTTAAESEDASTPTTLRGETVASYEIVVRIAGENGETLHIVIPPGAYTDVDLENFIGDLKEADPELWGAEVFDDEEAIQAFVIPEDQRTEEQQSLVEEHHFVSLVNGDTIRFQGPFAESGEFVIGS